jgi:hypothetical protein
VDLRENLSKADACLFRVRYGSHAKHRDKLIGLLVIVFAGFVMNACGSGSSQPHLTVTVPVFVSIAVVPPPECSPQSGPERAIDSLGHVHRRQ